MAAYTDTDVEATSQALYLVDYGRWTSGPDPLGTPWGTSREQTHRETYRRDAREVLDAAAPAIEVRTLREAAEAARAYSKDNNNKLLSRVTMRSTADWLDARADLLEKRTP